MRFGLVMVCFLLLASLSSAGLVSGNIYSGSGNSDSPNQTVITIQGPFTYQLVTNRSNYSLFLPNGDYVLHASTQSGALSAEHTIKIGEQNQQIDLVLNSPSPSIEYVALAFLVIVAVLVLAYKLYSKPKTQNSKLPESPPLQAQQPPIASLPVASPETSKLEETLLETVPQPKTHICLELDDDSKRVLEVLERCDGRATQKEIRETLGFSDSKLSLILTELEQTAHIKKFKRGRGNIVRKIP